MKQLIVYADMEGASGIFENNRSLLMNGGEDWRNIGRDCITSDVLAVVNAAVNFGIDDILLYDAHFAGEPAFNIKLEMLPKTVRVFDVPDRCFFWRRIRGQAAMHPFGLITVGQHARYGELDAYFPHTIQSPPIKNIFLNGLHVAEIGSAVFNFDNTPYLANIGCQASMREAQELSPRVVTIPVKDKAKGWKPTPAETYPLIYEGVTKALAQAEMAETVCVTPPYEFSMELTDGYVFDTETAVSWKGRILKERAEWTAPSVEIGFEIFNHVRALARKV